MSGAEPKLNFGLEIKFSMISFLYRSSLGQRIAATKSDESVSTGRLGNLQMTFSTEKKAKYLKQHEKELKKHRDERQKLIRPIKSLHLKKYVAKQ